MYNLKNEANMYVDNYEFKDWMQKLLDKLAEVGKDVKSLQTNPEVVHVATPGFFFFGK